MKVMINKGNSTKVEPNYTKWINCIFSRLSFIIVAVDPILSDDPSPPNSK